MATADLQIGTQLAGYELTGLIGRGGMGAVYSARDAQGQQVALKVLALEEMGDARASERFEREAQLASQLAHQHIVAIREAGRAQGHLFIAMELVEGESLRQILRVEGKPDARRAVEWAAQIAAALDCAHASGIVHRDIKAENVLIDAAEKAKILDFGIASAPGAAALTRANEIIGTIEYMAPEQILGDPVGPAADLYALGVLLYEMLVGSLPFAADSPATLVYHQLNEEPRAPSQLNLTVPRALDRLVLRLLDKEAENRPASAAEVERELAEILRRQDVFAVPLPGAQEEEVADEVELRTRHFRPRYAGPRRELAALRGYCDGLDEGGQVVFLAGEAGVGKTRIVEELREYYGSRNGCLVAGTCFYEHGMGPYMPLLLAVDELLGAQPDDERAAALRALVSERIPQLAPLAEDASTVARVYGGFAMDEVPEVGRQRLYDGLYEVLAASARQQPLVLVLEDVHWADEGTLQFIAYLARRSGEVPLRCIATYRPEEVDAAAQAPLATLLAQLLNEDLLREVRLANLGRDGVLQLADSLFLQADFGADFGDYLYEQSQGNPFMVIEVLKLLRQRQVVHCENGVWIARPGFSEDVVPDRVGALIARRLEELDDEGRELLDMAAIIGPSFSSAVLEKVAPLGRIDLLKALYRLERRHRLIESADEGYRFTHSKVREVLYVQVPPELRAEYHRIVASALRQLPAERGVGDEAFARHLFFAGEWQEALPLLLECSGHALSGYSWRLAAQYAAHAQTACERLGEGGEPLLEALRLGGEAQVRLGAWEEAEQLYAHLLQVAREAGRQDAAVEAMMSQGRACEALRQMDAAEQLYAQALQVAELQASPDIHAKVLLNLGGLEFELGRYEQCEMHWRQALALLPEESAPARADARNNLAVLATMRGQFDEAWGLYEEVLASEEEHGAQVKGILTYQNMGMLRADQERWDEALELYERALERCRAMRVTLYLADIYLNRAEALMGKGDLADARSSCARALRGYRQMADGLGMADALRLYGRVCRGERAWDEARSCLQRSLDLNRQFGETVSLGEALYEMGALECDMGYREAALEPLGEAERIFDSVGAEPDLERVRALLADLRAA